MKWEYIIAFVIVFSLSIVLYVFFHNPYPCTISCCGCSSWWEMIHDTWVTWVSIIGIVTSIGVLSKGVD